MRWEAYRGRRVMPSVLAGLITAGCGGGQPMTSAIPSVQLVRIATLEQPLALAVRANDPGIGDVGQNAWEEVDLERAASAGGIDYGRNRMEGSHPYEGGRRRRTP